MGSMKQFELYRSLLCNLLDCGYFDLAILEDTDEYFLLEAMERLQDEGLSVTLNGLTGEMFWKARATLREAVETRISDLETYKDSDSISDEEDEELETIKNLDPEDDIAWHCNYLDTSICFRYDTDDIYRKYFKDVVDELESKMGFSFL